MYSYGCVVLIGWFMCTAIAEQKVSEESVFVARRSGLISIAVHREEAEYRDYCVTFFTLFSSVGFALFANREV